MTQAACAEAAWGSGDNVLVSEYLEGNEYAFKVLVDRYQGRLVNYITSLIHDHGVAVDLAQDTFIRVFRNASRYRGDYQFSTWIYRIATNLAIDEIRRRERRGRFFFHNVVARFQSDDKAYPIPDTRQSPDITYDRKQKIERLQAAIDSLPPKYRVAFALKEIQDLSYEEISAVTGVSLGTVKSRIHRAKMLLRGKLAGVL